MPVVLLEVNLMDPVTLARLAWSETHDEQERRKYESTANGLDVSPTIGSSLKQGRSICELGRCERRPIWGLPARRVDQCTTTVALDLRKLELIFGPPAQLFRMWAVAV